MPRITWPTPSRSIDFDSGRITKTIALGGPKATSLARKGEAIFHDASRSSNQWYSCNTCHSDGHTNGLDFDTLNDGWQDLSTTHLRSRKKVPTLRRVAATGPWTWHGWQKGLDDAMVESFTKSMQGKRPSGDDVKAIVAYLGTLDYPRNPNRDHDGGLTPRPGGARRSIARRRPPAPSATAGRADRRQGPRRRPGGAGRRLRRVQPAVAPRRRTTRTRTCTTAARRPSARP